MSSFLDYMMDETTAEPAMKAMQEGMATRSRSNNTFYYYRKLDFGASSRFRFLPISTEVATSDEVRKRFTLAKKIIRLRFDNPHTTGSKVVLTIPAMQMYIGGKTDNDAVLKQVAALYNESDRLRKAGKDEQAEAIREKASYHWTRGEHLAQGFVVRSGFQETEVPENPIRIVELNKQLMNMINKRCDPKADPDLALRYWPVHGKLGMDFIIKKTQSGDGKWPSYLDSDFAIASGTTPWTDVMKAAVDTHGLWQLENFLPERPDEEEYNMFTEIMRLSIAGTTEWDPDWEAHMKPARFYKTETDGSDGEVDPQATANRVREALGRVGGGTATAENVFTPVTSVNQDEDGEPEASEDAEVSVVAATEGNEPAKTARDVRSIVDQIKRGTKKATTEATA